MSDVGSSVTLSADDLVLAYEHAPAQIPAGLAVALIGAPSFVYLLARSRARV